jgi:putative toxin-antitoxin system antitoxin component (TIGR02293 family)
MAKSKSAAPAKPTTRKQAVERQSGQATRPGTQRPGVRIRGVGGADVDAMIAHTASQQIVRDLSRQYELPADDIADVLDITTRTFSRWKKHPKALSNQQADRMMIVKSILDLGKTVLGSETHLKDWLKKPLLLLDGRIPLDLMKTESGRRKVESALHQIQHGFF